MRHNFRFRRLRKFNCLITLLAIIFIFNLICGGFGNKTANAEEVQAPREYVTVQVRSGDTLWDLVNEYYDYDCHIRKAILEVRELNNMESSTIYIGQSLIIPRN